MKTDLHTIKDLRKLHEERRDAIRARLNDFSHISPHEYFYELLYCLMTPQSSAEHAEKAVARLKASNFAHNAIDPEPILRDKRNYIRFHKTKSKHLLKVREEFSAILTVLSNGTSAPELREWLMKNVKGLGYKEATHFLRNIGKNEGLAILDRHILRNLKRYGVIRSVPTTITKKQYFRIEKRFMAFATRIGIPVDELDLLFWSMETGEIRK